MSYSAIIVLGNRINKSGKPNRESSSRMDVAIEAFYQKKAPYIITCGWAYRDDSSISIADAMKTYAVQKKVPEHVIFTEANSRDTVGDAYFTKTNIVSKNYWNKLLIVTSEYHAIRAYAIFKYIYGKEFLMRYQKTILK